VQLLSSDGGSILYRVRCKDDEFLTAKIRNSPGHRFIEARGTHVELPVVCLHGILGTADEWSRAAECLAAEGYHVFVPSIPFDSVPLRELSVEGIAGYVDRFVKAMQLGPFVLAGNSLGGQIALRYVLDHPDSVVGLVLAGSAGLYEVPLGTSFITRSSKEYLRKSTAVAFYDPAHADDALVERLHKVLNNRSIASRMIRLTRDSQRQNFRERLGEIQTPTAVIWGREDAVTPPDVAYQFASDLPNAELRFISKCGHAPMIEWPNKFGQHIAQFLRNFTSDTTLHPA